MTYDTAFQSSTSHSGYLNKAMFRNDKYNAMFENLNNIILQNNAMFNHI